MTTMINNTNIRIKVLNHSLENGIIIGINGIRRGVKVYYEIFIKYKIQFYTNKSNGSIYSVDIDNCDFASEDIPLKIEEQIINDIKAIIINPKIQFYEITNDLDTIYEGEGVDSNNIKTIFKIVFKYDKKLYINIVNESIGFKDFNLFEFFSLNLPVNIEEFIRNDILSNF
jgi:hypothetical protein